jgi:hypothetical protein
MTDPISNGDWLSFMYAIQRHVRRKLAEGMVADLQNRLREQSTEGLLALSEPEIVRAIKLLVPGLIVDFFMENPTLIDEEALRIWVEEQDETHLFGDKPADR